MFPEVVTDISQVAFFQGWVWPQERKPAAEQPTHLPANGFLDAAVVVAVLVLAAALQILVRLHRVNQLFRVVDGHLVTLIHLHYSCCLSANQDPLILLNSCI